MNARALINALERSAESLPAMVCEISDADAHWRPPGDDGTVGAGGWSIVEIICHLADEEVEDFRTRLEITLREDDEEWPPIDPEGVAVSRKYNERALQPVLDRFVRERRASVEGLRRLLPPESPESPDWTIAYQHPKFGPIRAGDLLAAWAAHDALHMRQISKRLFQLVQRDSAPYSTIYAGRWPDQK